MFLFFGGLPKKTNALGGHKGCVFSFLVLPEKNYRRAQGLCFSFFDASKKQVQ